MIEPLLFHTLPIFSHKRQLHPLLVLESFQNEMHFFKESRIRELHRKSDGSWDSARAKRANDLIQVYIQELKESEAALPPSKRQSAGRTNSGGVGRPRRGSGSGRTSGESGSGRTSAESGSARTSRGRRGGGNGNA
ncbi:hypothetical protein P8452_02418 [Trifolium repens]|nr:hypothetical protein P8452_02418 [Trifolium repens]